MKKLSIIWYIIIFAILFIILASCIAPVKKGDHIKVSVLGAYTVENSAGEYHVFTVVQCADVQLILQAAIPTESEEILIKTDVFSNNQREMLEMRRRICPAIKVPINNRFLNSKGDILLSR